jgi:hypothetical protein
MWIQLLFALSFAATELNEATFKDAMNSGKNVFVKFLAPW